MTKREAIVAILRAMMALVFIGGAVPVLVWASLNAPPDPVGVGLATVYIRLSIAAVVLAAAWGGVRVASSLLSTAPEGQVEKK